MFRRTITAIVLLLLGVSTTLAQRWEKVPLAAPYDAGFYLDIFFLPSNPQLGWACDQKNGYIVKTTDGGATWQGLTSIKTGCHLEYIQFLDANTGYCSGPCGAYKSTNGGNSWTELTTFPQAFGKWGGWFRDANTGWFTGGGCGRATFMRTTDGGASFSVYIDSTVARSNLTDALWDPSMPANTVYAIGNGTLWRSLDDGQTFQVYSYTGTNSPWHEELAHFGSSFAVSCAQSNCATGGYTGGGIRFTVDDGANWRHTEIGKEMFGVYLLDATTGWAAGWDASVYYTTNGGLNWELRNCGLEGADMDDITFLDPATGWVVGDGLFRLAPPKRTQSDTAFVFSSICPDSTVRDTVLIRNLNFFSSAWTATITGQDADLFKIGNNIGASIASCAPVPIIVEYSANRSGLHTALLRIEIKNPDTTLFVTLTGDRREKSAVPRDTLVTFNVRVGTTDSRQLMWRSLLPWNEQITAIVRISGDTNITLVTPLPLTVIPEGVQTIVRASPIDTGWIEAKFMVRLRPCVRDTIITVRVYGTSPILESIPAVSADMACKQRDTLRIPIRNTGNLPLDITDISLTGSGASAFRVLYWKSGRRAFPESFDVGVRDTLLVEGRSITGDDVADLVITNSDLSTKRGKKNPWIVALRLTSQRPTVTATPKVIDLGPMCIGSTVTRSIEFNNLSSRMGQFTWKQIPVNVKGLSTAAWFITPAQRRSISFQYTPTALGAFSDTLTLLLTPCDTLYTFVIKGVVNDFALVITPAEINDSTPSGNIINARAVVRMVGPGTATVTTIWMRPPSTFVTLTTTPPLPATIAATDSIVVNLRFTAQGETTVQGMLEATATAPCTTTTAIPVRFRSMLTDLDLSKRNVLFEQHCASVVQRDTITLLWRGSSALSMRMPVFDVAGPFSVEQPLADFTLTPNTPFNIVVAYAPQALGATSALLTITDVGSAISIAIPVTGDWFASNLIANKQSIDFGDIDACQPAADSVITLYNPTANERAVVSPVGATTQGGIELIGVWPLTIEPNDSATVTLRSTPAQTLSPSTPASFTLRDATCGASVSLAAQSNLVSGKLVIEPNNIDVGSGIVGRTETRTVIVYNPSQQPRTIISLVQQPVLSEWMLTSSLANTILQPNDTVRVDLVYNPISAGVHATQLVMVERGACEATTSVPIRGEATEPLTPPEHIVRLFIDQYVVGPGDTVQIPVHWQNDISSAQIDSVHIAIEYLSLPYVIDTVYAGTLGRETRASWTSDEVQFKLYGDATDVLGKPGVVGIMRGVAQSSIPDSTGFRFKSVIVWSVERVDSLTDDGSLIVDACGPRFLIALSRPTQFLASTTPDGLEVQYTAQQSDAGVVSIYNATGTLVATTPFSITPGTGAITIPNVLSSGVYVVHVESASRGRLNVLHAQVR